ncbi:MAG: hypothetical protein RLZZ301_861 [Bacteroidota bacterium]|jgi:hypothetical protein
MRNTSVWFLVGFLLFFNNLNANSTTYELYLFVYSSGQTTSGAGHISFAFGQDSTRLTYYTKYRKVDGGGFKLKDITYQQAFTYDKLTLGHQSQVPCMVLKLKAKEPDLAQLEQLSDHWNLEKPWTLFVNNCTDALKHTLRSANINPGLAFLISTPNELIEDLYAHHLVEFKNQAFEVLYGDLESYLQKEPNAVPQTLFGKKKQEHQHREAIVILTGFGSKYHRLKAIKHEFKSSTYDLYVPRYISRKSLEKTTANFEAYWQKEDLGSYEKIHVFAYIVGAWTINTWIEKHGPANIASIVYDRSTLQERAPTILTEDLPLLSWLVFGPIMKDLATTPYPVQKYAQLHSGLLLETYATAIVRKHRKRAEMSGPYCYDPSCYEQAFDDFRYVPLNHDQLYTHPEVFNQAIMSFFETGSFGQHLRDVAPVADPYQKNEP